MASRLYYPLDTAAEVSPTQDAGWVAGTVVRRAFAAEKGTSTLTNGTLIGPWVAATDTPIDRQYVSTPLRIGATFTSGVTTVKMQIMARETATEDDLIEIWTVLKVVSNDGTVVRATLLPFGNYGTSTELIANATLRNKTAISSGTTVQATYAAVSGDRLVQEIGLFAAITGITPQGRCRYGENGTDLPQEETQTTDGAPWLEISIDNLVYPGAIKRAMGVIW